MAGWRVLLLAGAGSRTPGAWLRSGVSAQVWGGKFGKVVARPKRVRVVPHCPSVSLGAFIHAGPTPHGKATGLDRRTTESGRPDPRGRSAFRWGVDPGELARPVRHEP